jgi:IS30 family transposase
MKKSKKLTLEERIQIKVYLHENYIPSTIAKKLGRARSTITRELNKWGYKDKYFSPNDYDLHLAYWYTLDTKSCIRKREFKLDKFPKLFEFVLKKLKLKWAPEQIAARLKREYPNNYKMNISHEAIYQYIYTVPKGELKKELISYLRRSKSKRKSEVGSRKRKSKIKDRISIDDRPPEVDKRIIPGHWESDLIIGKAQQSCIGTIVERTTRFTILVPLKNKSAKEVRRAFARELKKLPKELTKSMTHDNGLEMAQHKLFTKDTNIQVYFCHPYSSWERGTNENTNGLVRDFWPKGFDFSMLSRYKIKKVQNMLNDRPRRILNWDSPAEVFNHFIQHQSLPNS